MNIAIIDDDIEYLQIFREMINNIPDIFLKYSTTNIHSFLECEEVSLINTIEIVLLDVRLQNGLGYEYIPQLVEKYPHIQVVMISAFDDQSYLLNAIRMGAIGYILKEDSINNLKFLTDILKKDGALLSPVLAKKILELFKEKNDNPLKQLNRIDLEVLQLLSEGWSYQVISEKMKMPLDTVRYYIKRVYKQLHANSKAEAIKIYYQHQLPYV